MKDEAKRNIVFKVIENYLASNPDKAVNIYYRFNKELFLPLKFKNAKPMLVLNGQLVSFHYAATEHFGEGNQNAYINFSFLLSEIADITEFKGLKFNVKYRPFTDKINYFAGEYLRLIDSRPEQLTIDNIPDSIVDMFQPLDEELTFPEGKEIYSLHTRKERNKKLVALKKKLAFDINPLLPCEVCGISLKEKYGDSGEKVIEAHHLFPISELTEETEMKLDDLILVCPNCHRMFHHKQPWLTFEQMKQLLVSKN